MNRRLFSRLHALISPFLRGWKAWALAAAAYAAAYLLWLQLWTGSAEVGMAVGHLAQIPPGLLAARAALALRPAPLSPRLQRAWSYLGLAVLLWTAGGFIWALYALLAADPPPLPSPADLPYIAGHCAALIAVLSLPALPRGRLGRFRLWLDLAIFSGAVAAFDWLLLIQPTLATVMAHPVETFWMAFYPALDLALLLILADVFLTLPLAELRAAWLWIGAGLAACLVADLAYTYLGLRGQAENNALFDAGRLAGVSALGLGALFLRERLAGSAPAGGASRRRRFIQRAQTLLPLAAALALGLYTLFNWQATGQADPVAVWATGLLGLAVVARQGVVAGETELLQYAHLVNSAADLAFICDAAGRLQLVNPALLAAAGYAGEDELLGRSAFVLLAPGALVERGLQPEYIFQLGIRQGWSGEVVMLRRDGSRFPADLALRPIHGEGGARPVVAGTAHDLTEQKRRQAELRAAYEQVTAARRALETLNAQLEQKVEEKTRSLSAAYDQLAAQHEALQALDRLKSEFVSLVSHELRAPLTNIGGGIELALDRPDDLSARARQTLGLVQAEIRRLTQFVETILDLSALEAGRLPLQPAPLDLGPALEAVRGRWAGIPAGGRLRFQMPPDFPPLLADERGLTSVLFHLLDNALKYAPAGEVVVAARAEAGRAQISVTDHGPGIPPAAREMVFEKFQRLDGGDAQAVYGHGLGLYMARRLLQAMGGDIKIESTIGGAQFTFWLPLAQADHD